MQMSVAEYKYKLGVAFPTAVAVAGRICRWALSWAPIQRGNPKLLKPMHSPSAFAHYSAIQSLDDMLLLLIVFQHPRPHTQERIAIPSEALQIHCLDLYLPPNTVNAPSAPLKFGIWESAWVLLIEAEPPQSVMQQYYCWESGAAFNGAFTYGRLPAISNLCGTFTQTSRFVLFFFAFLERAGVAWLRWSAMSRPCPQPTLSPSDQAADQPYHQMTITDPAQSIIGTKMDYIHHFVVEFFSSGKPSCICWTMISRGTIWTWYWRQSLY